MSKARGYVTPGGYMGYVDGQYQLFATEDEYLDYISQSKGKGNCFPFFENYSITNIENQQKWKTFREFSTSKQ